MSAPEARFAAFADLHDPANPLVLVNVWDAGSAREVAAAGAFAVATGSWAVAAAHGFDDGERLPRDMVLANVARIVATVDVPVTVDVERGYGRTPADVAQTVRALRDTGAVGANIEDSVSETDCRSVEESSERLAAARDAAGAAFWINARTDVFLQAEPGQHQDVLEVALNRVAAYARAGASSLFVPGLTDPSLIRRLCAVSVLPVNVMATTTRAVAAVRGLGPSRISMGPGPYLTAMSSLAESVSLLAPGR